MIDHYFIPQCGPVLFRHKLKTAGLGQDINKVAMDSLRLGRNILRWTREFSRIDVWRNLYRQTRASSDLSIYARRLFSGQDIRKSAVKIKAKSCSVLISVFISSTFSKSAKLYMYIFEFSHDNAMAWKRFPDQRPFDKGLVRGTNGWSPPPPKKKKK